MKFKSEYEKQKRFRKQNDLFHHTAIPQEQTLVINSTK